MRKFLLIFPFILIFSLPVLAQETLTLEESARIALDNNPSVGAAEEQVRMAQNKVLAAFGERLPSLNMDAAYRRAYQQPSTSVFTAGGITQTVTFGPDAASDNTNYTFTLSQPIYTFGRLSTAQEISNRNLDVAQEDLRLTRQELIYNVKAAYLQVLESQDYVRLAKESLGMADEHLSQANAMLKAGVSTQSDVLRTKVQAATAQHGMVRATNSLDVAKAALNTVLGRDVSLSFELSPVIFTPLNLTYDFTALLKIAYAQRPDWRKIELSKRIAEGSLWMAKADLLPMFALTGSYGRNASQYPTFNSDTYNWNITAGGSWKLGIPSVARIEEASANTGYMTQQEIQLKNAVAMEVKQAHLDFETAKELIKSSQVGVDSARENLKVATLRYNAGVGTNIDVIDAQTSLTKAELDLTQARFGLELARAKIDKVTGKDDLRELIGRVKYIDLEGGFLGFTAQNGDKYNLMGGKVNELKKTVGRGEKRIIIFGYPKPDAITIQMWGTPFVIVNYRWN